MLTTAKDKQKEKRQTEEIRTDFRKWVADTTHLEGYDNYEIKKGEVLVRVYQYVPTDLESKVKNLVDLDGNSIIEKTYKRIIPLAKVLSVKEGGTGELDLKAGDIITLPDYMVENKVNDEWVHWQEMMKERPLPETDYIPQKYVNRFSEWRKYLFIGNKFKVMPEMSDALTFLIPTAYVKSIVHDPQKL